MKREKVYRVLRAVRFECVGKCTRINLSFQSKWLFARKLTLRYGKHCKLTLISTVTVIVESFVPTEAKDKDSDREASCYKPRRAACVKPRRKTRSKGVTDV